MLLKWWLCCAILAAAQGWNLRRFVPSHSVNLPSEESITERDERFMGLALREAERAASNGEVPIGALIVKKIPVNDYFSDKIVSRGRNRVEQANDASQHAELVAMRQAAKKLRNWRLTNCTLYTTLEPCSMCLSAALQFRIDRIVYAAADLRLGAVTTHMNLLDFEHPFHNISTVDGGVLQDESASMMRHFFRERRKQKNQRPDRAKMATPIRKYIHQIFHSSKRKDETKQNPTWEISDSLQAYVQQVRDEMGDDSVSGGVSCVGEPAVDPSRQIQPNQGDSEWVDDW